MGAVSKTIQVFADWDGMPGPTFMGTLHAGIRRGAELVSFEYDGDWLASPEARALDPDIKLTAGRQYLKSFLTEIIHAWPLHWRNDAMPMRKNARTSVK